MASFSTSHKHRSSGTIYKPLAESSRNLVRKLWSRPQSFAHANHNNTIENERIPSPRIGSAEDDCVLYNAVSGLMDVDFLRDKGQTVNGGAVRSNTGFLYVVNPDLESHSPPRQHSDLSVSMTWGKLSISPRPSSMGLETHGLPELSEQHDDFHGDDIIPAPLRLRKRSSSFTNPVNSRIYHTIKSTEPHSENFEIDSDLAQRNHTESTADEEALERHLSQLEQQTADLRKKLIECETKLSQMTGKSQHTKEKPLPLTPVSSAATSRTSSLRTPSSCSSSLLSEHQNLVGEGDFRSFSHIDFSQDAKQVALLSHMDLVGMCAQRSRGRLPRALVGACSNSSGSFG